MGVSGYYVKFRISGMLLKWKSVVTMTMLKFESEFVVLLEWESLVMLLKWESLVVRLLQWESLVVMLLQWKSVVLVLLNVQSKPQISFLDVF